MSGDESFVMVNQESSIISDLSTSTNITPPNECVKSNDKYIDSSTTTKPNDDTSTNEIVETDNTNQTDSNQPPLLTDFDTSMTTSVSGTTSPSTNSIIDEDKLDFLKASVFSQFPSISMECADDVVKLQNLLSEHADLKKTLNKSNLTMKRLYEDAQKWKLDLLTREVQAKLQIEKLYNENHELRRQLEVQNRFEQTNINAETRHGKSNTCVQCLSENCRQLEDNTVTVQDFEQLSSTGSIECIPILEHQRIVCQFERQISSIEAQNIELTNMQKKTNDDLKLLKAIDMERSAKFTKVERELKESSIEIDMLRDQIAIYINDFKVEKDARENLAKEKDELLTDLRDLLRKNQELVKDTLKSSTKRIGLSSTTSPSTSRSDYIPKHGNFSCPLCKRTFDNLNFLQIHVNQCLDET